MDFCQGFQELALDDRERFTEVVSRLMAGTFVTPGTALRPDKDWRFIDRYALLIDAYLQLGGWRLEFRPERQVARVVHPEGAGRVQFDRLTTACLVLLRLLFHEQMGRLTEQQEAETDWECSTTVGELRESLIQRGFKAHQVSPRLLVSAVRALHRAQIVDIEWGFTGDSRETIGVRPVIESILPATSIDAMRAYVQRYARAADPGDGGPAATQDVVGVTGDAEDGLSPDHAATDGEGPIEEVPEAESELPDDLSSAAMS